ncbi:MAG: T9SS type A sorting domain-containing protein [Bacteroidia bacterium]|nr:T9SS type A sorting domain-containing protein [Bacteroidia bacterium]
MQKDLYFFGYTGGQQAAKEAYENQLHSVAAQQMLIEQLSPSGSASQTTSGRNGTGSYFLKFYANLKSNGISGSNGWPMKVRKICLVNGDGNGTSTHKASDLFLSLDAYKRFIFNLHVAEIKNRFMPETGSSNTYFKGKITSKGFLNVSSVTHEEPVTNSNPRGSMDIMPGGLFNAQAEVRYPFAEALNDADVWDQYWSMLYNHCFIPTISALGFKNANFKWDTPINNRDLVKTGEIPFDNYYIPLYNQDHVSLTAENVTWLIKQLEGNYYNQSNIEISGPDHFCDQEQYEVEGLPTGATVQWKMVSGESKGFGISSTGLVSKIKPWNEVVYGRPITIEAKVTLSDGVIIPLSKEITTMTRKPNVGIALSYYLPANMSMGYVTIRHNDFNNGCVPGSYLYSINNMLMGSRRNYTMKGEMVNISGSFDLRKLPFHVANKLVNKLVLVRIIFNPLKTDMLPRNIEITRSVLFRNSHGTHPRPYFSLIQSSDLVTLKINDEEETISDRSVKSATPSGVYEIQLWNATSLLDTFKTDSKEYQISVSHLPAGIYIVRLIKDGEVYTQKIIKK